MSTLEVLTGPGGPEVARRALAALGAPSAGLPVLGRVHHRPGSDTTVGFGVGAPGASETTVWITDADVAAPLVEPGTPLRAWVHPGDPRLPGLARAMDPAAVAGWLASEGRGAVACELLSYRPLRRAVVRVTAGGRRFYVKLWTPAKADGLIARHRVLDAAGVGPRIAAELEPGVLVVHDADGVTLAQRLAEWNATSEPLPAASEVIALLDRLPDALLAFPVRDAWTDRADFHGAAAAAALPECADEIGRIVTRLGAVLRSRPEAPRVPTHGDFYEANVLVSGTRFASVIDVDTAGPGRRVDDLACLLGHLAVLPDLSPQHYRRVGRVTRAWASEFERHVDPGELRARTAGVILSLIAGTTPDHGLARLAECRDWLERAEGL